MKIINLLPKTKQRELQYEALFHSIFTAAIFGFATLLLVGFLKVGLSVYLQRQQTAVSSQIEQTKKLSNKEENAELKVSIDGINSQLKDYQDLSKSSPLWSKALRYFSADVPEGVKITTFNADSLKKQVDIGGYAPTRDLAIQLYNKINEDKDHFRDIDYPLENVARAEDVDFHFTFFVQDSVLGREGAVK
jgi:Tfp pilus assembly protein PilN